MHKLYYHVILRVFGVKQKQIVSETRQNIASTTLPDVQCGSFNVWIKDIYHQLNPSIQ